MDTYLIPIIPWYLLVQWSFNYNNVCFLGLINDSLAGTLPRLDNNRLKDRYQPTRLDLDLTTLFYIVYCLWHIAWKVDIYLIPIIHWYLFVYTAYNLQRCTSTLSPLYLDIFSSMAYNLKRWKSTIYQLYLDIFSSMAYNLKRWTSTLSPFYFDIFSSTWHITCLDGNLSYLLYTLISFRLWQTQYTHNDELSLIVTVLKKKLRKHDGNTSVN